VLELEDADTGQDISPTRGFRYTRLRRVISQSSHGLYCESNKYNNVFGRGSSWMTRNLSETPAVMLAASSLIISCGGNRKLFRSDHSVTLQQSSSVVVSSISFILYGCLNPDITADKVSLSDGDDADDDDDDAADDDDGERIIDRCIICQIM
jgi:hypothetical protein